MLCATPWRLVVRIEEAAEAVLDIGPARPRRLRNSCCYTQEETNPDPRPESRDRDPIPETRIETLYINIYKPERGVNGGVSNTGGFEPNPTYCFSNGRLVK